MSTEIPSLPQTQDQLRIWLASPEIAPKPRVGDLLRILVEAWIRGEELSDAQISVELGKIQGSANIVRATKYNLKACLKKYAERTGRSDPILIDIPKGRPRVKIRFNPTFRLPAEKFHGPLGPQLLNALGAYFGLRPDGSPSCPLTGEPAVWHHLDGNEFNNHVGNFVPLAERFKRQIDKAAKPHATLPPELDPRRLGDALAPFFFGRWEIARAYACTQLAFHLGAPPFPQESLGTRMRWLRQMLYYARHRFSDQFISYAVRNLALPLICDIPAIDPASARVLALELTTLANEWDYLDRAEQFLSFATGTLERDFESYLKEQSALFAFSVHRRRAQLLATLEPSNPEFHTLLRKAESHAGDANAILTLKNVETARDLRLSSKVASRRAYERMLPLTLKYEPLALAGREPPPGFTAANSAEIFIFFAIAVCRVEPRNWRQEAEQAFATGRGILQRGGSLMTHELWNMAATAGGGAHRNPLRVSHSLLLKEPPDFIRADLGGIVRCLNGLDIVAP